MDLLPFERSTALWQKCAFLYRRLGQLLSTVPSGRLASEEVGEVFARLYALRARSRATLQRLDAGERLGPETSVEKILVGTAEQALFDLAADGLAPQVWIGDDAASRQWRTEFLFSRAATIYGGTIEIQRNIVARRLLDLGPDA
jgi:alkylation response protein AidB-like acyl-CoA dehydrogenase